MPHLCRSSRENADAALATSATAAAKETFGANNEQLPERLQNALRRLILELSTESEISRRAENRALVNSILGLAGIPPVRLAAVTQPDAPSLAPFAKGGNSSDRPARNLRRRSWHQIGRALEIEDLRAARRERESDTDTFPPPRNVMVRD